MRSAYFFLLSKRFNRYILLHNPYQRCLTVQGDFLAAARGTLYTMRTRDQHEYMQSLAFLRKRDYEQQRIYFFRFLSTNLLGIAVACVHMLKAVVAN